MRMGIRTLTLLALIMMIAIGGCSQSVSVVQVTASLDQTRLEIIFDSCNVSLDVDITESNDAVTISATQTDLQLIGGGACQDLRVHELSQALADRPVVDGATGVPINVLTSGATDDLAWPYDRSFFSEKEYEEALTDMVSCLEQEDSALTAWVEQQLDWKWYSWEKPPEANGTASTPAVELCEERYLVPLQSPTPDQAS